LLAQREQLICPVHGKVERDAVVKGYEVDKDQFVVLTQAEIEDVQLETTRTVELVQFIDASQLDPIYLDAPYYLGPDGPVAQQAYTILCHALRQTGRIGIGRVVVSSREKIVAVQPVERGLQMTVLRYPSEVRPACACFEDLPVNTLDKTQMALARELIENQTAPFNPSAFTDRYQAALLDLIKGKLNGNQPLKVPPTQLNGHVLDLVEALTQSIARTKKKLPVNWKARRIKRALAA
jgi:DNA end-binding protein Ku